MTTYHRKNIIIGKTESTQAPHENYLDLLVRIQKLIVQTGREGNHDIG